MKPGQYYMRDPRLVAVGRKDRFLFCRDGAVSVVDGVDGPALSWALEGLVGPTAGGSVGVPEVVDTLVAGGGVLEASSPDALAAERDRVMVENQGYHFAPGPTECGQLVLGMTGTVIAGLMAPYVLSLAYSRFQSEIDLVFTEPSRELRAARAVRVLRDPHVDRCVRAA